MSDISKPYQDTLEYVANYLALQFGENVTLHVEAEKWGDQFVNGSVLSGAEQATLPGHYDFVIPPRPVKGLPEPKNFAVPEEKTQCGACNASGGGPFYRCKVCQGTGKV